MRYSFILLISIITSLLSQSGYQYDIRLKDLAKIGETKAKSVIGYGIVVGLEGTGDGSRSIFTVQSIANMLEYYGIKVDKNSLKPKNVAAVMVTADLPTYGKKGTVIDVMVSSIGDAKSLQGGNLLLTPLTDPVSSGKSEAYVFASGAISIGGFNIAGENSSSRKNYTLVGRIPGGGRIEKELGENLLKDNMLSVYLNEPDYTTAVRVSRTINNFLGEKLAYAQDKAEVKIRVPVKYQNNQKAMEFIALIEVLKVQPDNTAKVVVNERTGTIIIGEDVRLEAVAISHGNLQIKIEEEGEPDIGDPFTFTEALEQKNKGTKVEEEFVKVIQSDKTTTLKDLVEALNKLGVTPRDMISIFQALKQAGALHAELVLI